MAHTYPLQQQIVLASGNPGKIKEIQAILAPHPILAQSHFNVPEVEETATTFVENALLKARNAALHAELPALADDSGLVVDALKGAPGVISARYAGVGCNDQDNIKKLLAELAKVPEAERTARFICIMVFMQHPEDPFPLIAQGVWEGRILLQPAGDKGFGYDPVFWVPSHECTAAELTSTDKNLISHRGQALQQLKQLLSIP